MWEDVADAGGCEVHEKKAIHEERWASEYGSSMEGGIGRMQGSWRTWLQAQGQVIVMVSDGQSIVGEFECEYRIRSCPNSVR